MTNEEKLMELLRRAHAVIGEGPIENAIDESAESLHNEIAEVLGLPVVKRASMRCTVTWFVSGGREQRQCRENADPANVCAECGEARCDEHEQDLAFYDHDGRILCGDCAPEEAKGDQS